MFDQILKLVLFGVMGGCGGYFACVAYTAGMAETRHLIVAASIGGYLAMAFAMIRSNNS